MYDTRVWEEEVVIPTYEIGKPDKNPMFLEKRVYQGSSGKIYPYPTIDTISDTKVDKTYKAVYLENEYLKVMILPELGGRIQRAYDKTNGYDFVYYNHVIKPALVGLTGPWISGGIEFNWPQHHRPTTFLPVDYSTLENKDSSKSVLINDVDQMNGTKGMAKITLYSDKAYIEIAGQLYNRTALPQTFLWWANPAVSVNDYTQSIFPPDVHAVMDHGKRDVSKFPIATGIYYKKDYSRGVDISRYKNIPVPTSYMAEKSDYNFVGGYDHQKAAGILHVADHHICPGKKQWTWGCGDFGKAWDRNLTDEDGPYIELMTGVFTDNQPDFSWLKPFEEKTFTQYFMPYKAVGQVKNATIDAAVNLTVDNEKIYVCVYATAVHESAQIIVKNHGTIIFAEIQKLSPYDIFEKEIYEPFCDESEIQVEIKDGEKVLVSYKPKKKANIEKMPKPAEAVKEPEEIMTNEELYLAGLHIEQYRHATYLPDPYYLEGLKRDAKDIRINNAYGVLLMRRGELTGSEKYFKKALERLIERNPNPYDGETYYNLGLCLFYQKKNEDAYAAFYKATWSNEEQEMSFYYLAAIDAQRCEYELALEHIEKGLVKNAHNVKARGLKAYVLRKLGCAKTAKEYILESLDLDPFDYVSHFELSNILVNEYKNAQNNTIMIMEKLMRRFHENYLMCARDYAEMGGYEEAIELLKICNQDKPMIAYYRAYYLSCLGREEEATSVLEKAEKMCSLYCFPNKMEDIAVLEYAIMQNPKGAYAYYYLGDLFYDKLQFKRAIKLWEQSRDLNDLFPTVHRNLSLAYFNKQQDAKMAKREMEKAFFADSTDARVFLELDQLYKKLEMSYEDRLEKLEAHMDLVQSRDDLFIEYVTLKNMVFAHESALTLIESRKFHPWEGGEGKITTQYTIALTEIAKNKMKNKNWDHAKILLKRALIYPENLGEGKLEGTKDNQIYYLLGIVNEKLGNANTAVECYTLALLGDDQPAGMMYYNDQPADAILFQGLAQLKLNDVAAANARFYKLIDYGEKHFYDKIKVEYFAVSLPDFLIFDLDYTKKNEAHCNYLIALGNWGLGNTEIAQKYFHKALLLEPSHMQSNLYIHEIEKNGLKCRLG